MGVGLLDQGVGLLDQGVGPLDHCVLYLQKLTFKGCLERNHGSGSVPEGAGTLDPSPPPKFLPGGEDQEG